MLLLSCHDLGPQWIPPCVNHVSLTHAVLACFLNCENSSTCLETESFLQDKSWCLGWVILAQVRVAQTPALGISCLVRGQPCFRPNPTQCIWPPSPSCASTLRPPHGNLEGICHRDGGPWGGPSPTCSPSTSRGFCGVGTGIDGEWCLLDSRSGFPRVRLVYNTKGGGECNSWKDTSPFGGSQEIPEQGARRQPLRRPQLRKGD